MDKSLGTLLRALRSGSDQQDVSRLLGSATTLLTLLSNPLNITLLASQLLSAPSIWQRPDGLRTTSRILSIFNSAASRQIQQEGKPTTSRITPIQPLLSLEAWAIAIAKGADDRSPRWRHLCVLAGLLIGFEGQGRQSISTSLRKQIGGAVVKAVNLSLQENNSIQNLAASSVALMLSHVFDLLSDTEKLGVRYDLLLPVLQHAPFFGREGLHLGYFLSTIDVDVIQNDMKFDWSSRSTTYVQCQRMATGPLIASLGSLSRLTAFSVEHVHNVDLLPLLVDDLATFTRSMCVQWRQNKLSEIDITEEETLLSHETLQETLPLLWRVLKSSMFAIIVIQSSLLGRLLGDPKMPANGAPFVAIQTLRILHDLHFISSRLGGNAFSQYTFVYLAAIDILSQYPVQAEAFLREIRPTSTSNIPEHPLDRCHDLYFLNTVEHFTTIMTPEFNEKLLLSAATPYVGLGSDPRLFESFEAAHSVMLAVLSSPRSSNLVAKHIEPYVDVLFKVFPQNLSPRQFRMAIKTLIRITSPPSAIADTQPLLSSTILELVCLRLATASSTLLHENIVPTTSNFDQGNEQPTLSEQAVLVLSLIDALTFLSLDQLQAWLPVVAESLKAVQDHSQRQVCKQRFWAALSTGEMDVERASLCVTWWSTKGGKELVLNDVDHQSSVPFMSGGLQEASML